MNTGRIAITLAVLIAAFCCEPAKSAEPAKRIVVMFNGEDPFWDAARGGAQQAERDLKLGNASLVVDFKTTDFTPESQIELLRRIAVKGDVAGVAIPVIAPENPGIVRAMKQLRKDGVHVICFDADVDVDKTPGAREYYLGTDNSAAGKLLGTAVGHLLRIRKRPKGSYAQFVGLAEVPSAKDRMDGFQSAIGKTHREAARYSDGLDLRRARTNVEKALVVHDDLVALVGIWGYNGPAIAKTVVVQGKRKAIIVAAMDASPGSIEQMAGGNIDAMVVQDPFNMGYQSVRLLAALHQKNRKTVTAMFPKAGKKHGDRYDTGLKLVVPDDSPLKADMFKGLGERTRVMKFSDFKKWLKQRKLTGS